jgi:hypothetical protein
MYSACASSKALCQPFSTIGEFLGGASSEPEPALIALDFSDMVDLVFF